MQEQPPQKTLHENILSAIQTGKVHMRPRWHFMLKTALLVLSTVLACLAVIYLVSFIIFMLRQNGAWFAPTFGLHGLRAFLLSLPWVLIALSLLCAVILEVLVRRYQFAYGRPLMYSVLGVVALVLAGGLALAFTPMHGGLLKQARNEQLPFAGAWYKHFDKQLPAGIETGLVTEVHADGCNIQNPRRQHLKVLITPQTRMDHKTNLEIGDMVMVLGRREQNVIYAEGIREIPETMPPAREFMK